nr:MAG TPA: hypothetical protein [Caudoviricetes sp.]
MKYHGNHRGTSKKTRHQWNQTRTFSSRNFQKYKKPRSAGFFKKSC